MATLQKINANSKELDIEYRIRNFSLLPKEVDVCYPSPYFYFANATWRLDIYPNGSAYHDSTGVIGIYLTRESDGLPISLECSVGLKRWDGTKETEKTFTHVFTKIREGYGITHLIPRSKLFKKKSKIIPFDELIITLFLTLKDPSSIIETSDTANAAFSSSNGNLNSKTISSHEKTSCPNKLIRCPECSTIVFLQKFYEHEYQTTRTGDDVSLTQDYKKVLLDGKNHDLIFKIGDKELRAHKDILRARSRVFQSMLDHDMKEKNTGAIDVLDCDPQIMELFLSYVYCGRIESLDQNNMFGLYYVADKYEMQGLKDDCCEFIKKSLSITNI